MDKAEQAARNMESLCTDNSHGYSQSNRWGPDYDCSSAVIMSWERAGVPVKSYGASYTGNMYPIFQQCGFVDVTSQVNLVTGAGLHRSDVLLNHRNHTAMYMGHGTIAQASINENGGVTGGQPGDQTGREIWLRSYYNYPWDCVLRYGKVTDQPQPQSSPQAVENTGSYTVQANDTLYGISIKTGVPIEKLIQINKIQNPNIIHVGDVIQLQADAENNQEDVEQTETDLTEVAKRVIRGEFGNGVTRTILLKLKGYDPTEVQKAVNKILLGM